MAKPAKPAPRWGDFSTTYTPVALTVAKTQPSVVWIALRTIPSFPDVAIMQQTPLEQINCVDTTEPPRSVLIIEDDDATADVLSIRLSQQGFTTYKAHTGHDGLALASAHHPNLVLLDLGLPDTSGLAVCQQLVDDPATCDIPIIILSGMQRPDIIRHSRSAGCRYYVRKPYDPNALLVLIDQAIEETELP